MKLFLCYENVERPLVVEIDDDDLEGFLQEYEEALHDNSVETFQWKGSSFRIAGLLAVVQDKHLAR